MAAFALWRSESGQDTVEYTLLLAFIVLVAASMFLDQEHLTRIWAVANNQLVCALNGPGL